MRPPCWRASKATAWAARPGTEGIGLTHPAGARPGPIWAPLGHPAPVPPSACGKRPAGPPSAPGQRTPAGAATSATPQHSPGHREAVAAFRMLRQFLKRARCRRPPCPTCPARPLLDTTSPNVRNAPQPSNCYIYDALVSRITGSGATFFRPAAVRSLWKALNSDNALGVLLEAV